MNNKKSQDKKFLQTKNIEVVSISIKLIHVSPFYVYAYVINNYNDQYQYILSLLFIDQYM